MKGLLHSLSALAAAVQLIGRAGAADIAYITDLKLFSSLAPCAAAPISENFNVITYSSSECAEGETQLQSCICSRTADFSNVYTLISTELMSSCSASGTLTDDLSSASMVLKKYCSQDAPITFPTPNIKVNAYITDLAQITYLPSCAQSAVISIVSQVGYSRCPQDASLYAPCVCSKSGVIDDVTTSLRSVAKSLCSGNNEDASSAEAFFFEYCAMNKGTTSFATPEGPPGDMTYQITALPQFKSLNKCAQTGVSLAVFSQTGWLCGSGPQALASCVCLKSGIFDMVSTALTTEVKWQCSRTATDDVSSAVEVLKYYCSAANNKVVASVNVPPASTTEGSTGTPTNFAQSESRSFAPKETESPQDKNGTSSNNSDGEDKEKDSGESKVNRTAIIAASVLGAFLVLIGIAAVVFFVRRKRRRDAKGEEIPSAPTGTEFQEFNGKPELAGPDPVVSRPGTGRVDIDTLKPELPTTASYTELPTPTTPNQLSNPAFPNQRSTAISEKSPTDTLRPELPTTAPAGAVAHPMPHVQRPQELVSPGGDQSPPPRLYGQPVHEFPVSPQSHRGSPVNGFPAHQPPVSQGWDHQLQQNHQAMGWQSGPVQVYEMDSNVGRRNE